VVGYCTGLNGAQYCGQLLVASAHSADLYLNWGIVCIDEAAKGTSYCSALSCARKDYMPFSSGQRVCPGAGFAMIEDVLMIAMLVWAFKMEPSGKLPVPVTHLTVGAKDGMFLKLTKCLSDTKPTQTL
jgi:hypothetical protein